MAKPDFYELLGVSRDADEKTLKSAFRKKAMEFHPDRNPGDAEAEQKFKAINEAYEVLRDDQKRAAYDRFGHQAFEQGGGFGGFGGAGAGGAGMGDIFEEIFGEFMGGARRRSPGGAQRGSDVRYNLEITLEEAFEGKTVDLVLPVSTVCGTCSGSGAKPGTQPTTCGTCGGLGKVRMSQGFFAMERTCPTCGGRGEVIKDPCETCNGTGRVTEERTLSVSIPAGIDDGNRIRVAGEGEAGVRGAPSGDLYIFVSIKPHAIFQRDGADLFCRAPISVVTAALGGAFEVPALDGGRARVKVPEGTQTGKQFRLRGKGMPILRQRDMGDMYVQVMVETPQNLTKRQRELLEAFEEESGDHNHPETSGFFSKVKDFFGG
ncbi:MAG: molecular chaperone DnaJ [Devosiaceae bacterium]|nr:molecular chaperone DnaJ [Devosiaceae bacterium MH13]